VGSGWAGGPAHPPRLYLSAVGDGGTGYAEDLAVWNNYAVGDMDKLVFGNLLYEMSAMGGLCTSVAFDAQGLGMVHARNMDWPLPQIRSRTILIDFDGPAGPFTAVTMPGYIGVLSAVAPGRFSATINSTLNQPWHGRIPNFSGFAASFALRSVFESCEDYDDAIHTLLNTEVFSSFYVQVVGPKRGQAALVRMLRSGNHEVLKYAGKALGISNHWPLDDDFADRDDDEWCTDSLGRLAAIERAAQRLRPRTLRGCFGALGRSPVRNDNTTQTMVMSARTGEVLLG
jgi:hypothetical protein